MRKLLRLHGTYCTNALDVLFIHNGNRAKVNEWKKMCSRNGYSIVHGLHNDTTGSGRGAAALLMKMSTFNLTEKDSETQPSPGGRIAHKKVLWKDMILNPVSIYVPVNADERITFRKQQIFNHKNSTRFNNRRGFQLRAGEPNIRCCKNKWRYLPKSARKTNQSGHAKETISQRDFFIKYIATQQGQHP